MRMPSRVLSYFHFRCKVKHITLVQKMFQYYLTLPPSPPKKKREKKICSMYQVIKYTSSLNAYRIYLRSLGFS